MKFQTRCSLYLYNRVPARLENHWIMEKKFHVLKTIELCDFSIMSLKIMEFCLWLLYFFIIPQSWTSFWIKFAGTCVWIDSRPYFSIGSPSAVFESRITVGKSNLECCMMTSHYDAFRLWPCLMTVYSGFPTIRSMVLWDWWINCWRQYMNIPKGMCSFQQSWLQVTGYSV